MARAGGGAERSQNGFFKGRTEMEQPAIRHSFYRCDEPRWTAAIIVQKPSLRPGHLDESRTGKLKARRSERNPTMPIANLIRSETIHASTIRRISSDE